ncbi:RNA-directed DNA polymerase, eukaryota, reverse transcriptase zinc-binding domain protein [Tanacetum coccineum]
MLCLIETIPCKVKMFYSFVYAANSGVERRNVWNDLCMAKNVTINHPWLVMGDFNVTMNCSEHSFGGSAIPRDMQEFIDCVNTIEVEDTCSSGAEPMGWLSGAQPPPPAQLPQLVAWFPVHISVNSSTQPLPMEQTWSLRSSDDNCAL